MLYHDLYQLAGFNLKITVNDHFLLALEVVEREAISESDDHFLLYKVKQQLDDYFYGQRQFFDLPINLWGTDFQKKVWQALLTIPYGQSWSYQQVAQKIGNPQAYRAVGNANHCNPLIIIIPCHRVVKANGEIGGYGGGEKMKEFLLILEKKNSEFDK